ncbi:4'-phosphopantetheinyl transferase superfamily protein [Salipaludibacillus agaradhaerens]|uniref:4'-phosphopantetheinyl transferase superfamily protein n=1 Tax=Salipaludibacillus agaradhaerens TaxID=76935 RepID=A0A9Q4B6F5_SALAG|nr:4'-phosphopantetheinyl transferase superfamily protein [Salipaludibacillus agaradhaerens]MCR6098785.1 4'-phosphopantetheinyl transferase superfamily protein [Salipaludibacillus agaradhaerens]MCR6115792.1 4'-phosphopantetheinyl transferase superfamily protein [Salipaludibacillus agaradhaerens]
MYRLSPVKRCQQPRVFAGTVTSLERRKQELLSFITSDEQERARKIKRKQQRETFLLIRGYLRSVLSPLLNRAPQNIRLAYGTYGKPFINEECPYQFNVSHSKDRYLIGVRANGSIGVDVECYRTLNSHPMFFHPEEIRYISKGSGNKIDRWLWLWTRKEAFGKAIGEGLSERIVQRSIMEDVIAFEGKKYVLRTEEYASFTQSICIELV